MHIYILVCPPTIKLCKKNVCESTAKVVARGPPSCKLAMLPTMT